MDSRHQFRLGPIVQWKGGAGALWADGLNNADISALIRAGLMSLSGLKAASVHTLKESGVSDRGVNIIIAEYQSSPKPGDSLRMIFTVMTPFIVATLLGLLIYSVGPMLNQVLLFWSSVVGVAAFGWIPLVMHKPYQYRTIVPVWIIVGPMMYIIIFHAIIFS